MARTKLTFLLAETSAGASRSANTVETSITTPIADIGYRLVAPGALSDTAGPMFIVTNRIPVAEGHEIDFEDRFKKRVHLVDQAPGFVRNEVHRPRPMKLDHTTGAWSAAPEKQGFYEVKTWWRSFEDFVAWTKSDAFAEAHRNRAPKEMFAGPSELTVHELLTSTDLEP